MLSFSWPGGKNVYIFFKCSLKKNTFLTKIFINIQKKMKLRNLPNFWIDFNLCPFWLPNNWIWNKFPVVQYPDMKKRSSYLVTREVEHFRLLNNRLFNGIKYEIIFLSITLCSICWMLIAPPVLIGKSQLECWLDLTLANRKFSPTKPTRTWIFFFINHN